MWMSEPKCIDQRLVASSKPPMSVQTGALMSVRCYLAAFKVQAVKQRLEHGHSVTDVSHHLDVSTQCLSKKGAACADLVLVSMC